MYKGIMEYINKNPNNYPDAVIATDIQEREGEYQFPHEVGEKYDFLSDNYKNNFNTPIDYIIMNPPYSVIEPFVMKSLGLAEKGILMLCRLQFLEGKSRYENILKDNPPSDIWVYVDRISCYKNGNDKEKMASAQAYCWAYWNLQKENNDTKIHWIRRK